MHHTDHGKEYYSKQNFLLNKNWIYIITYQPQALVLESQDRDQPQQAQRHKDCLGVHACTHRQNHFCSVRIIHLLLPLSFTNWNFFMNKCPSTILQQLLDCTCSYVKPKISSSTIASVEDQIRMIEHEILVDNTKLIQKLPRYKTSFARTSLHWALNFFHYALDNQIKANY